MPYSIPLTGHSAGYVHNPEPRTCKRAVRGIQTYNLQDQVLLPARLHPGIMSYDDLMASIECVNIHITLEIDPYGDDHKVLTMVKEVHKNRRYNLVPLTEWEDAAVRDSLKGDGQYWKPILNWVDEEFPLL